MNKINLLSLSIIGLFLVACGAIKKADINVPKEMKENTTVLQGTYKPFKGIGGEITFGGYRSDKFRDGSIQFKLPLLIASFKKQRNSFSFLLNTPDSQQLKVSGVAQSSGVGRGMFSLSLKKAFKGKHYDKLDLSDKFYTVHVTGDNAEQYALAIFDLTTSIDVKSLGKKNKKYKGVIELGETAFFMKPIRKLKGASMLGNLTTTYVFGFNIFKEDAMVATISFANKGKIWLKNSLSQREKDAIVAIATAVMTRGGRFGTDNSL